MLYLFGSVFLEFFKILVEHLSDFLEILVVIRAIGPAVSRVEDLRADPRNGRWVFKVENGKGLVFGFSERSIMDCIDDVPSRLNADPLRLNDTFLCIPAAMLEKTETLHFSLGFREQERQHSVPSEIEN